MFGTQQLNRGLIKNGVKMVRNSVLRQFLHKTYQLLGMWDFFYTLDLGFINILIHALLVILF